MKKLIIFDMDGTLIDSSNVIVNSINHIRKYLKLEPMSKKTILENINNPQIDGNKFFYSDTYFDEKMTQEFNRYYTKNCVRDLEIFDEIDNFLKYLKKYFILAVATNTPTNLATKMLQHLNLDKYFDIIVGSDKVTKAKPYPDILFYTMNKMKQNCEDTLFIGDSKKDKQTATNANVDFISVNWNINNIDDIKMRLTP